MKSHFFAYISKIRWLQRWGLKRNAVAENVRLGPRVLEEDGP